MKLYKIAFIIFGVLLAFTSCKEEEVEPFSEAPGLNFMASDGYGGFYDSGNSYENLSSVVDFFSLYAQEKTMDLSYYDVKVCLQLEGRISDVLDVERTDNGQGKGYAWHFARRV